jgi:hypothetical protein
MHHLVDFESIFLFLTSDFYEYKYITKMVFERWEQSSLDRGQYT